MKKVESDNSDKLSVWQELDIKFFRYKELRDEASREAVQIAAYKAYSYDYLARQLSSWPTTWVDEVRIRLGKKIDDTIDVPDVVKTSFKGYLHGWFRSIRSCVNEKRLREVIGLPAGTDAADVITEEESPSYIGSEVNLMCDRLTPATHIERNEKMVFMQMLWRVAKTIPGLQGRVFNLYLKGLTCDHGDKKGMYKYEGIANRLGINPRTVASYIHRSKLALRKRFLPAARIGHFLD